MPRGKRKKPIAAHKLKDAVGGVPLPSKGLVAADTLKVPKVQRQPQLSPKELDAFKKRQYIEGLPHLYHMKMYAWQRSFFESRNKMNLLTAANQIGKSTIQIRKCIHWATNKKIWPELWPTQNGVARTPNLFWYLYPSKDVANYEWETKWKALMPRGAMKEHPVYGWQEDYDDKGKIESITFNSGVIVVFKTYGQKVSTLQTATVYAVFCDEELPEDYYDEIAFRLEGTEGYFHLVFTATLGQQLWYQAMECQGAENEKFADAHKQQISMYDCRVYEDGTPGPYHDESRILRAIARCKSNAEVQKRVFGRFVLDDARKYSQYDPKRHFIKMRPVPDTWHKYGAVDIGSGGRKGAHPPAISFVAVSPDHRMGYVYKGWRGDDGRDYTSGDVLDKFIELRGNDKLINQRFDQNAKDFGQIATRIGEPFLPSEKHHDIGEDVVNTLFKNDMLFILDDCDVKTEDGPQLHKLGGEMLSLKRDTPKAKAKDDFIDSMRYCVVGIPWDWSALRGEKTDEVKKQEKKRAPTEAEIQAEDIRRRRGEGRPEPDGDDWREMRRDIDFWNDEYGT